MLRLPPIGDKHVRRFSALAAGGLIAVLYLAPAGVHAQQAKPAPSEAGEKAAAVKPIERPFLWMIEGPTPSFVFGTIHIPDERVTTLPAVVENAIAASGALYTEIPMDMQTQMSVMPRMARTDGRKLSEVLPKDLYEQTAAYMKSKGADIAPLEGMNTWVLIMQLAMLDIMKKMQTEQPLDSQLFQKAVAAGKEVGGLETVDEQMGVFESMTEEELAKSLRKTLEQLKAADAKGIPMIEQLTRAYIAGDAAGIEKLMFETLDLGDPVDKKMYDKLLTERNRHMADRIAKMTKGAPDKIWFFAVGAGHLTNNENGVIKLLQDKGLKLRRLTPADADRVAKLVKSGGEKTPADGGKKVTP